MPMRKAETVVNQSDAKMWVSILNPVAINPIMHHGEYHYTATQRYLCLKERSTQFNPISSSLEERSSRLWILVKSDNIYKL